MFGSGVLIVVLLCDVVVKVLIMLVWVVLFCVFGNCCGVIVVDIMEVELVYNKKWCGIDDVLMYDLMVVGYFVDLMLFGGCKVNVVVEMIG